ncbi:hypothetical protein RYX36_018447, partial [Vicia faba]
TTTCVTVATTTQLIDDSNGWYYKACHQFSQVSKGDTPPYICRSGHKTEAEIWRRCYSYLARCPKMVFLSSVPVISLFLLSDLFTSIGFQ